MIGIGLLEGYLWGKGGGVGWFGGVRRGGGGWCEWVVSCWMRLGMGNLMVIG